MKDNDFLTLEQQIQKRKWTRVVRDRTEQRETQKDQTQKRHAGSCERKSSVAEPRKKLRTAKSWTA